MGLFHEVVVKVTRPCCQYLRHICDTHPKQVVCHVLMELYYGDVQVIVVQIVAFVAISLYLKWS